ncbi:kinase-associated lipoprotein B [Shouchella clausii]|uniref:kinase-associated lipoprotein B n=1 Tax=Shouchella tritolerans TaxID=2979466 RepID=UPI0007868A3E|nr:kinase-associated lipoprotein B [Shouchella tritolerans]GIN10972.1 kinase-associated lipoprotein B [Shouchella clausii]
MELSQAKYKSGIYIGNVLEVRKEENRALFQVLAVLTHPNQGDLHHPKQIDVPFFHERKALAYLEKAWVPFSTVKAYEGELPDYETSLKAAWEAACERLQNDDSDWAIKSLQLLKEVRKEYSF